MIREVISDADLTPLAWQFRARARHSPHALAFAVYPPGAFEPVARLTWHDWYAASRAIGASMLRAGVSVGDRVAVLAGNRPLWPIVDLAIQMIGAVGVGIYPTSTVAQVAALLADSAPTAAFVAGDTHLATLRAARDASDSAFLIVADSSYTATDADVDSWTQWLTDGALLLEHADTAAVLDARLDALSLDDIAALIYTSGSTGEPKGACISHRYLAASAVSIARVLELRGDDRALSFLPYSHAAERVFGQCTRIATGMAAALIEDATDVFSVASRFEPTLFGGLPRLFERLYEASEVARREGRDPRAAITERVGHRCRVATSGGAALPVSVGETLAALGLPILGAYGQTEHLCLAMNRPAHFRFDAVGLPMPGTTVRIAPDGELLVARSALTFSGYWRKPEATEAAFIENGAWLRTGDRAELDADGMLRITGRVKELIALSTGRKVAPLPIEAALTSSPYIAHAVCYGEGRKYLVALVSLRRAVVEAWAREHDVPDAWPALAHTAAVRALVDEVVARVNQDLARTDRIVRVGVTDIEFTLEGGELTPTLKVVRGVIAQRFSAAFEALYA